MRLRIYVPFALSLLGGLLVVWLSWPANAPLTAQSGNTPTAACNCDPAPTPVATQAASWSRPGAGRVPSNLLQKTAAVGLQGDGPDLSSLCADGLLVPQAVSSVYRVDPTYVSVNDPATFPVYDTSDYFIVEDCGNNPDRSASVTLIDPAGERTPLTLAEEEDAGEPLWRVVHWFEGETDLSGEYTVEILTNGEVISQTIQLQVQDFWESQLALHEGPRFTLRDAETAVERQEFAPGDTVEIVYDQYEPDELIEVGLYDLGVNEGVMDGFGSASEEQAPKANLVNSWLFAADENGAYSETLTIPLDTPIGEYALAAAPVALPMSDPPPDIFRPDRLTFDLIPGVQGFYRLLTIGDGGQAGAPTLPPPPSDPPPGDLPDAPVGDGLDSADPTDTTGSGGAGGSSSATLPDLPLSLLLSDDFIDPNSGLPELDAWESWGISHYAPEDGLYIFEMEPESWAWWSYGLALPATFRVDVVGSYIGAPGNLYGLIFQQVTDSDYYAFQIDGYGNYLVEKLADGEWEVLIDWTESDAILTEEGAFNRLSVYGESGEYTLFINGQEVGSFIDFDFQGGSVGPLVTTFEEPGAFLFSSLDVAGD